MADKKNLILIVEDSDVDYDIFIRAIKKLDLKNNIYRCCTGDEAINYFFNDIPATIDMPYIILLDLNLPGTDGFGVLERLKQDKRYNTIPIIVFTTSPDVNDVKRSYELGANSYIRKAADLKSFISSIERVTNYWFEVVVLPPKLLK